MHRRFLQYLICLRCQEPLELQAYEQDSTDQTIRAGLLISTCGQWYPVVKGVPRVFPEHMFEEYVLIRQQKFLEQWHEKLPAEVQKQWNVALHTQSTSDLKKATAASFGYEWKRFNKMFDTYRQNFLNYVQPFTAESFKDKVVIDVGCGVGRHTYWAAKFGARDVVGLDLSDAVEPAEENCRQLPNAHIVQGDIYNMPFRQPFDFCMSIGVIHHLPDPELGFQSLLKHTKSGGVALIWVYGRKANNMAVWIYEPIRTITRHIPPRALVILCYPFAGVVEIFNRLADIFERVPGLKQIGRMLPFQYYRQFPFEVKLNDAFDVLATPKSRYYQMSFIRQWFDRAKLPDPQLAYLREKSIIAYARVP